MYFDQFGEVFDVKMMRDKFTGNPRGFGFVHFKDTASVDKACVKQFHTIDKKQVEVKRAVTKSQSAADSAQSQIMDACKLFVGGLPQDATADDIKTHFEVFGKVRDIKVMYDQHTNRSRGFGFVTYEDGSIAENVLKQQHTLKTSSGSKWVDVKKYQPKSQTGRRPGFNRRPPMGGYGGGYGAGYGGGYGGGGYGGGYGGGGAYNQYGGPAGYGGGGGGYGYGGGGYQAGYGYYDQSAAAGYGQYDQSAAAGYGQYDQSGAGYGYNQAPGPQQGYAPAYGSSNQGSEAGAESRGSGREKSRQARYRPY